MDSRLAMMAERIARLEAELARLRGENARLRRAKLVDVEPVDRTTASPAATP